MKVEGVNETVEVGQVTGFTSQVRGAFKGWIGSTEIEMTDGQVWKQNRYLYHYQYSYMPEAVAYLAHGEWMMSVGESPFVAVRKIR